MPGSGGQQELQGAYHRGLFGALHDWERAWAGALDIAGTHDQARSLGVDQLGHFGSLGSDLVVDAIAGEVRTGRPLALAELGCGFGGVLRHVVAGLRGRGFTVGTAVGFDIVPEHLRVFAAAESGPDWPGSGAHPVLADVRRLPVRDDALDVVVCTGSLPHFADVDTVFAEASRVLASGGLLVMTEEVGLMEAGQQPSAEFRRYHPVDVFFACEVGERLAQLRRAGFGDVAMRDLTAWASGLLGDRSRAMSLFEADSEALFGSDEAQLVRRTLDSARAEYARGAMRAALVTARTPA
jgi:ubiquinone/menaquinone biosynthesis C-methylase UbiE